MPYFSKYVLVRQILILGVLLQVLGQLSVIIPIAPGDRAWKRLLPELQSFASGAEILGVGAQPAPASWSARWIESQQGRAIQLNAGARSSHREFLWFLHADSRITRKTITALEKSIQADRSALHYFDLVFLRDASVLVRLNEVGAWLRSHLLGLPFGDQGFCMSRSLFEKLGGFDETVQYGEDHLLVWKAKANGIRLKCTQSSLGTSARKYRERGWAKTTLKHFWLTARQGIPEAMRILRSGR